MTRPLFGALVAAGVAGSMLVSTAGYAAKRHDAGTSNDSNDPVVALVGGDAIHKSDVEVALQQMMPPGKHVSLSDPKVFDQVRNDLISRKIAYLEGQREGLQNTPEVKHAVAIANQQIVTNAFFAKVAAPAATEDKMRQAYDEVVKTQPKQDEVHARHILVKSEDEAKDIIKQLDGGADFEKLAKEKSIDKGNAQDGGDLGYFTKGNMDPTFSEAAFGLQPNTYTKTPIKTNFGYHVIQVLDKRPAKIPTFEEAKPQLRGQLAQRAIQQRIVELAKGTKIQAFNIDGSPETALPPATPRGESAPAPQPGAAATTPPATTAPLQLPQTQSPQ